MWLTKSDKRKAQKMLKDGDLAPVFDLPSDSGEPVRLKSLRGRPVVLFFYPKDDTEGCTLEAREFSALAERFERADAHLIGISPDSPRRHVNFKCKHELDLCLVSDEEKAAATAYGVWVQKSMYGKTYMGVERSTFLISRQGRILQSWRKVKPQGHAAEVLAAVEALTASRS
jgi:peroxiredoxin Q/BCP